MSPLSPLRVLTLGILSWVILAGGIYCVWEGYERLRSSHATSQVTRLDARVDDHVNGDTLEESSGTGPEAVTQRLAPVSIKRPAWPYLLGGCVLLLWSIGGRLPAAFLLSSGSQPFPQVSGAVSYVNSPSGARIAVEVFDRSSAPTLLFTHGWSLDRTAWNYAVERFQTRYRVVTWDLPGLGESTAPADKQYSMEQFAKDLHEVLKATDNGQPIYLVGHSIGGMIIQTYMRLYPNDRQVHGIALAHTTYTEPLKTMLGASVWTSLKGAVIVPLNKLMIALSPLFYVMNWQSYFNGSMHKTTRFTSFTGKQTYQQLNHAAYLGAKAWPAQFARGNLAMMRFDAQDVLPNLRLPVHVIAGQHDRVTKQVASERICKLIDSSPPTAVDGGHLSIWEYQQHILDSLETFLAQSSHATVRK